MKPGCPPPPADPETAPALQQDGRHRHISGLQAQRQDVAPEGKARMTVRYKLDAALLALALPLFVTGLLLPAVSVSSLWIFNETFSLTDGALQLLREGEYALFVLVFVFTFVFPALKILVGLAVCLMSPGKSRLFRRLFPAMAALSKWSMLDVFVVAVIVVMLEGSLLSDADARPGLFLFAASVVLSTLAVQRLKSRI